MKHALITPSTKGCRIGFGNAFEQRHSRIAVACCLLRDKMCVVLNRSMSADMNPNPHTNRHMFYLTIIILSGTT